MTTGNSNGDERDVIPEPTMKGSHLESSSSREVNKQPPYLEEEQPLVSKDSETLNGGEIVTTNNVTTTTATTASAVTHEGNQVLVSEPSKEGPCIEETTRHDEAEWHQRPPWPLLSSPNTADDPKQAMTAANTRRRDVSEGVLAKRRDMDRGFQPSPTNGWPQRSPIKPEHEQEETSFMLFTHSFDTLSETGNYLRDMDHHRQQERHHYYASPSDKRDRNRDEPPRKIDLTESSLGDISPIKLDDNNAHPARGPSAARRPPSRQANHYQRHCSSSPRTVEFAPTTHYEHQYPEASHPATSYSRSSSPYGSGYQHGYDHRPPPSNPFFVLRSSYKAFEGCSYLLPCLRDREICPVNLSQYASAIRLYHDGESPDPEDLKIASRRVEAAIYAFGGYYVNKSNMPSTNMHPRTSIFRLKGHRKTPSKEHYDGRFHDRYLVNGNHISWEMEEHPPVGTYQKGLETQRNHRNGQHHNGPNDPRNDNDEHSSKTADFEGDPNSSDSVIPSEHQQKMKYRCKLCGQLKQNHDCPFQQSLQRSIAVMVFPAVNAFTASEPGILTKPLSEMNNFVSYDHDSDYNKGGSPQHYEGTRQQPIKISHVTPETTKTRVLQHHSDESSLSTHSADPSPARKQMDQHHHPSLDHHHSSMRKRSHAHLSHPGESILPPKQQPSAAPFFVPALALRPEHYRAVTPRPKGEEPSPNDYQYPHVPLTFRERKRLSDTLFFLSKDIPNATPDVAALLRVAREKEEWDLAVADVLTQMVVALYCGEGDFRLDGLQQYLLGIGISC